VGTRVAVVGSGIGIVRFVGETRFKPGTWVGVELEEADGRNDGSVQGVRYFQCAPARGIFVLPSSVRLIEGDGDRAGGACETSTSQDFQASGFPRGGARIRPISSGLCDTSLFMKHEPPLASASFQNHSQISEAGSELHDVYCADWCKPELFSGSGSALGSTSKASHTSDAAQEFSIDVDEEQRLLTAALDGMRAAVEEATRRAEAAEARLVCGDLQVHLKECLAREVRESVQSVIDEATSELRTAMTEIRQLRAEVASSSASSSTSSSARASEAAEVEPHPRLDVAADSETMLAVKVAAQQALASTGAPKDHGSVPRSVTETGSTASPAESAGASAGCRSEGGSGDTSPKQTDSWKQVTSDESNDSNDTILLAPSAPWPRWREESQWQPLDPSAASESAEPGASRQLQSEPACDVTLRSPPRHAQDEPSLDEQPSLAEAKAPSAGKLPAVCRPMAMQRVRATVQPLCDALHRESTQTLGLESPRLESPRLADAIEAGESRRVKDVVSEWEKILPLRPSTPTGGTPLAAWPFGQATQRGTSVLAPPLKPNWSKRAASLTARTTTPTCTSATAKIVAVAGIRPERQITR